MNYYSSPKEPKRDNKATKVGSEQGYSVPYTNITKIRFPSLKRGKYTWDRFYRLFPFLQGFRTKNDYIKDLKNGRG